MPKPSVTGVELALSTHPTGVMMGRQVTRWRKGLYKKYAKLMKPRVTIERRQGILLMLDSKSVVDRYLLVHGEWEPQQVAKLRGLIASIRKPGQRATFLDIGAHGGYYSLLMHADGGFDAFVLFEPAPVNAAQLMANLFLNGVAGTFRLVQAAVAAEPGTMRFSGGPDANRGLAKELAANEPENGPGFSVPAVRIDDVVAQRGGFIAAKIDVEGGEMGALAGMVDCLAANDAVLQIERVFGDVAPLTSWLEQRGFTHVGSVEFDQFYVKIDAAGLVNNRS